MKKTKIHKPNADLDKSAFSFKAIRNEYADLGVENYYQQYGNAYENPHFPYIQQILEKNRHRIDYSKTLDLACGGGEVTLILRGIGFGNSMGCDPFTFELFEKNTGIECLKLSFEDIIKGQLAILNQHFSSIISSFAMHLCPKKQLYALVSQLFMWTKNVVIITPHKRPELEKLPNVQLAFDDFVLTERGKKVYLKSYSIKFENL
ncbi:MAG: hypothetical protein JNL70_17205 [Saprospiraceae bacterium]|nr:hypothetical protein [Saprospiraceae bacterium]